jgi:hypothetical protein
MTTSERTDMEALHVADAGMDATLWRLRTGGINPASTDDTLTITTEAGTADVSLNPMSTYRMRIRSEGRPDEDPTTVRAVEVEVFHMSLWNFIIGADHFSVQAGGGGALSGTLNVQGPFYVRGHLAMSGDSEMTEGPLFVHDGDITMSGSASIGEPAEPIEIFCNGNVADMTRIHGTVSSDCPQIELPPMGNNELVDAYNTARAESLDGLRGTTGLPNTETRGTNPPTPPGMLPGYYKVIDADDVVGGATQDLTLGASTPAFGAPQDDFTWDPSTGALCVEGTVFVDGDLTFTQEVTYHGKGTFIVSGDVNFDCGKFEPQGGWTSYPEQHVVGFATPNNIHFIKNGGNTPDPTYADADFHGAWYAGTMMTCDTHLVIRGSLLSNHLNFDRHSNVHLLTDPALPSNLPPSLPGGDSARTIFITRWHEGSRQ